ncbi:hypothetical protein BHM03_00058738 [Ensete ventricosum]|nr:hypothetical protein BHM03_00058738 [Ensete ventricosum]
MPWGGQHGDVKSTFRGEVVDPLIPLSLSLSVGRRNRRGPDKGRRSRFLSQPKEDTGTRSKPRNRQLARDLSLRCSALECNPRTTSAHRATKHCPVIVMPRGQANDISAVEGRRHSDAIRSCLLDRPATPRLQSATNDIPHLQVATYAHPMR